MALLTCPDCNGMVSDTAPACPHCGRPMAAAPQSLDPPPASTAAEKAAKAKKNSGCGTAIAVVALLIFVVAIFSGSDDKPAVASATPEAKVEKPAKPSDAECAKDLHCVGEKHAIHASVYCKDKIEAHAAHEVKWSDGMFSPSMSRYRWGNEEHTSVTYIGDKVAFQNGFGAFTPMTYFCTIDIATDAILDLDVAEGRLPVN